MFFPALPASHALSSLRFGPRTLTAAYSSIPGNTREHKPITTNEYVGQS